MARLIDADALIHSICNRCNDVNYDDPCEPSDCAYYYAVHDAPTVDAMEVVRCKDCFWWHDFETHMDCRNPFGIDLPEPDDFCSRGERRTK